MWVATAVDGAVTRVASDMAVLERLELGADGLVALAGGSLWVTVRDPAGRNLELVRLDRRTGRRLGRLRLGARLPTELLAVGTDVWVVVGDGTVLVVR